jgi:sigma-B regulation protein RsbU (phosphoserine phosphatase)
MMIESGRDELSSYYDVLQEFASPEVGNESLKDAGEREKAIARLIQGSFLPRELPKVPGWEVAGYLEAARNVGGDFYDSFLLSGDRRIGAVIGDVCDKGVGAALFMTLIRSLLHAFADQHYSLGWMDVLEDMNSYIDLASPVERRRKLLSTGTAALKNAVDLTHKYILKNHGHTSMFATLFFAVIDPNTGIVTYINAGHEAPVILGAGHIKCRLEPTGVAIGLPIESGFEIQQITLEKGDMLFAYTDGVTDARDPQKNFFTEERLLALLEQPKDSAAALLEKIVQELKRHISIEEQYDDITMLAVRRGLAV